MANECINQVVLSGDRKSIFDLILTDKLHYTDHEVHEFENNQFTIIFSSDWNPPEDFFIQISRSFPKIRIQLFYVDKLLGRIGKIIMQAGEVKKDEKRLNLTLGQMALPIKAEVFNAV